MPVTISTSVLQEWASDRDLPAYLRIQYLAMARVDSSGHASFARGELQSLLDIAPTNVHKAINKLIDKKMILSGSNKGLIMFPPHVVKPVEDKKAPVWPVEAPEPGPHREVPEEPKNVSTAESEDPWADPYDEPGPLDKYRSNPRR